MPDELGVLGEPGDVQVRPALPDAVGRNVDDGDSVPTASAAWTYASAAVSSVAPLTGWSGARVDDAKTTFHPSAFDPVTATVAIPSVVEVSPSNDWRKNTAWAEPIGAVR